MTQDFPLSLMAILKPSLNNMGKQYSIASISLVAESIRLFSSALRQARISISQIA